MRQDSSEEVLSLKTIIMKDRLLARINGSNSLEELELNLEKFCAKHQESDDLFSKEDIKEISEAYILKKMEFDDLQEEDFIKGLNLPENLDDLENYFKKIIFPALKKLKNKLSNEDINLIENTYREKKSELLTKKIIHEINFSENSDKLERNYKKNILPRPNGLLEKDFDSIKKAYELKKIELEARSPNKKSAQPNSFFNKERQALLMQLNGNDASDKKQSRCCLFS